MSRKIVVLDENTWELINDETVIMEITEMGFTLLTETDTKPLELSESQILGATRAKEAI